MTYLSAEGCQARRTRLWAALEAQPDWILICEPQHQMYLASYFQHPFVFNCVNAAAVLILGRQGQSILVADNLVQGFAQQAHVDEVVTPVWYDGQTTAPHRRPRLMQSALERLKACPGRTIGLDASATPAGVVEGLRSARGGIELIDVDPVLHRLKRSKAPDEVALIRRAIQAGEAGQAAGLRDIRPGMTEFDAYLVVQQAALRAAGDRALVYGDFVSGPRCEEEMGGPPTQRVINAGDLVLLDFSVVLGGYRGDFCNTFACGGGPTAGQRRLHAACLEALAAAEALLAPGRPAREIDAAVRASFAAKGLAETFVTHTGHGLGLGHPDAPYLVPDSQDTLVAGDVIAIEPGQYVKGTGGMRYERNYLITESGYETLSHHELRIEQ
ncbi:MAG: Xaa-Pro peptidase family protein [Pirellulales bacterium]